MADCNLVFINQPQVVVYQKEAKFLIPCHGSGRDPVLHIGLPNGQSLYEFGNVDIDLDWRLEDWGPTGDELVSRHKPNALVTSMFFMSLVTIIYNLAQIILNYQMMEVMCVLGTLDFMGAKMQLELHTTQPSRKDTIGRG